MAKRNPPLAPFALDYSAGEIALPVEWIDGKTIFRNVIQVAGGNQSTINVNTDLIGFETLLPTTSWSAIFVPGLTIVNRATLANTGIQVNAITGTITIAHTGFDLTGQMVNVILEYTKL